MRAKPQSRALAVSPVGPTRKLREARADLPPQDSLAGDGVKSIAQVKLQQDSVFAAGIGVQPMPGDVHSSFGTGRHTNAYLKRCKLGTGGLTSVLAQQLPHQTSQHFPHRDRPNTPLWFGQSVQCAPGQVRSQSGGGFTASKDVAHSSKMAGNLIRMRSVEGFPQVVGAKAGRARTRSALETANGCSNLARAELRDRSRQAGKDEDDDEEDMDEDEDAEKE